MADNIIIEKIYEYDNYRFFLKDFFNEQKRIKDSFSHRSFAQKAGFASSSFFSHVVDGKRGLTESSADKMLRGISIRGRRATFFKTLVQYNQAETVEEREELYRKLNKIRRGSELFSVNEKQWSYYDEWYYPVIRELAVLSDWESDYKKLGELVTPVITPDKARKAIDLLVDIGMLKRTGETFALAHNTVSAKDVPAVVTRKMRREFIHLAEEAMENLAISERHISGVTVTLTERQYIIVEERLNELRQLILSDTMGETTGPGKVYQINLQAYPLTKLVELRGMGGDDE